MKLRPRSFLDLPMASSVVRTDEFRKERGPHASRVSGSASRRVCERSSALVAQGMPAARHHLRRDAEGNTRDACGPGCRVGAMALPVRQAIVVMLAMLLGLSWALGAEEKMETRTFRVPVDFVWLDGYPSHLFTKQTTAPADPFAPATQSDPFARPTTKPDSSPQPAVEMRLPTAESVLRSQGIPFPEGSKAYRDPLTGLLVITNTKDNLDLVETFLDSIKDGGPRNILSFHLQTFQLPVVAATVLIQATASTADHTAELERLSKAAADPASNVKAIATSFVRTKSGQRVRIAAERQHTYISEADVGKDGHLHNLASEIKGLGFNVEIDPVLGPDGYTIDVNIRSDIASAPPDEASETSTDLISGKGVTTPTSAFHVKNVTTALSMISGSSKLLSVWQPTGRPEFEKGDVRWVTFLTAHKVPVEAVPRVREFPGVAGQALPEGWKTLVFPIQAHLQITDEGDLGRARGESVIECLQRHGAQLPAGSRVDSTPDEQLLVTSSLDALSNVSEIVWGMTQRLPHGLAFTFHTIRAPSALMRPLVSQAEPTSDHRELLRVLLAAVDQGKAQCVDTSIVEGKSGMRAKLTAVTEQPFISDFIGIPTPKPDDKKDAPPKKAGQARGPEFDTLAHGTSIELEPVLGPDATTIDLLVAFKRHTAPPEERGLEFRDLAHNTAYRLPFLDSHEAKIETSVTLTDHGTQLLGVYRPSGVAEDVLEAVLVTAEVITNTGEPRPAAGSGIEHKADPNDKTMRTRVFDVPPELPNCNCAKPHLYATATESEKRSARNGIVKSILLGQGVSFPDGASVEFDQAKGKLTIINTAANLELVEDFARSLENKPTKNITFNLHLFEAPGPMLRRLISERGAIQNHHPMLEALRAAADVKQARSLSTLRLETKSGQRAKASDGIEKPFISEVGIGDDGQPFINHDMRTLGPSMEVDPVIGPDGWTIDLEVAVKHSTAPPEDYTLRYTDPPTGHEITIPQFRFHQAETTTAMILQDGNVKLLSVWKPTGPAFDGKDVLQCALLEAHIVVVK